MGTSIWTSLLDLIAPRYCLMCGERLDVDEEYLCSSCYQELPRTYYHLQPYENRMAQLFWGLLPIERATAWFYYAPHTQTSQILYELKYHYQPDIGISMGQYVAEEIKESGFFDGIDVIVPVPLTKKRQRKRGYNQSVMIARGISSVTGIPVVKDAVRRLFFRQSQTELDRWERMRNVEGMFEAVNAEQLRGRHVLLVDDVTTTGATLIACAKALRPKELGLRLSVLTLGFTHS